MKFVRSLLVLVGLIGFINLSFAANHAKEDSKAPTSVSQKADAPVNINKANAEAFDGLKGIGQKKAEAIVAYRKQNGNFKSIDDLLKVKGMSQRILDMNKGKLVV